MTFLRDVIVRFSFKVSFPHLYILEVWQRRMRFTKVHMATRWTIRHDLMLLWFKDLMNVTEKLQFIDPTFRHSYLDQG